VRAGDVSAWTSAIARAIRAVGTRTEGSSPPVIEAAAAWADQHAMTRLADRYAAIYERVAHR
jgi:hypothetical protein